MASHNSVTNQKRSEIELILLRGSKGPHREAKAE